MFLCYPDTLLVSGNIYIYIYMKKKIENLKEPPFCLGNLLVKYASFSHKFY